MAAERLPARAPTSGGAASDLVVLVGPAIVALGVAGVMLGIFRSPVFGGDHEWVTVGWSLLGGVVLALGFAFQSGIYRRTALAALALCLLRVFVVDTQHLGDLT